MDIETTTTSNNTFHTERKIFNWEQAIKLIDVHNPKQAHAVLKEDPIFKIKLFENGEIINNEIREDVSSYWATPCLQLDNNKLIECWYFQKD